MAKETIIIIIIIPKRQPAEWGEIFANEMNDKGLLFKRIQTVHTVKYQK